MRLLDFRNYHASKLTALFPPIPFMNLQNRIAKAASSLKGFHDVLGRIQTVLCLSYAGEPVASASSGLGSWVSAD